MLTPEYILLKEILRVILNREQISQLSRVRFDRSLNREYEPRGLPPDFFKIEFF